MLSSSFLFGSVSEICLPLANFKSLEKIFLRKLCELESKVVEPLCAKCDENSNDLQEKAKAKVLAAIRKTIEVRTEEGSLLFASILCPLLIMECYLHGFGWVFGMAAMPFLCRGVYLQVTIL